MRTGMDVYLANGENMGLLCIGALLLVGYIALRRDIKSVKPAKRVTKKKTAGKGKEMVYVLANPSYRSGVFKVGLTTRTIVVRMRELFTTGVPTPFVQCIAIETDDCKELEAALHEEFKSKRINKRREFFELTERDLAHIVDGAKTEGYVVVSNDVEVGRRALGGTWLPSELKLE